MFASESFCNVVCVTYTCKVNDLCLCMVGVFMCDSVWCGWCLHSDLALTVVNVCVSPCLVHVLWR